MAYTLSGQLGDRSLALIGIHCILELYDCPATLLDDLSLVQQALREAVRRSNSTFLGELCHQFEPHGITALALLGESHISIHTWPEAGYAAVDVFTCGRHTQPELACEYLITVFQARGHSLRKVPRCPMGIPDPVDSLTSGCEATSHRGR
ncbi:MAG: adenosylmethionine decarboxylase [Cyanobacteriota bacterium]